MLLKNQYIIIFIQNIMVSERVKFKFLEYDRKFGFKFNKLKVNIINNKEFIIFMINLLLIVLILIVKILI